MEQEISIHAPREGSDTAQRTFQFMAKEFLSTLPARGATNLLVQCNDRKRNFYPRSPRGERPQPETGTAAVRDFYPRSPRGERPLARAATAARRGIFLSTLPARGATHHPGIQHGSNGISIHAPREGSDALRRSSLAGSVSFLSTLPARGATGQCLECKLNYAKFLSTLPARGATHSLDRY